MSDEKPSKARKGRPKRPPTVDVHVRLDPAAVQEITHGGRKPVTRAIYDAVRVYRWLVQKQREGCQVGYRDASGQLITVNFLDDL